MLIIVCCYSCCILIFFPVKTVITKQDKLFPDIPVKGQPGPESSYITRIINVQSIKFSIVFQITHSDIPFGPYSIKKIRLQLIAKILSCDYPAIPIHKVNFYPVLVLFRCNTLATIINTQLPASCDPHKFQRLFTISSS